MKRFGKMFEATVDIDNAMDDIANQLADICDRQNNPFWGDALINAERLSDVDVFDGTRDMYNTAYRVVNEIVRELKAEINQKKSAIDSAMNALEDLKMNLR